MPKSSAPASVRGVRTSADGSPIGIKDLDQLSILDQTSDAIIITDLDATVIFWNAQAERLLKKSRGEALGKSIFDAFIPHVGEMTAQGIVGSFEQDGTWSGELPVNDADGQHFIVSVTSSLLRNKDGEPIGIIGLGRDITQRKRMERELETRAEELKRSNEELQEFAYVVSHDLQEPLRTASFFADLLAREASCNLDDRGREHLRLVLDGTARMGELIDDLLEYSRLGTRGQSFAPVDMNEVVDRALRGLSSSIAESGAEIAVNELPTVNGDRAQLVQMMQNLLSNAVKFRSERPPRVEISFSDGDGETVFSIRDNGIGIDAGHADRLFKMFSRLHTRDEYPGTGMGLAIAKRIVERHGGRIWFESVPGEGTTFHFTVPS
jgi:PAS domain S-box-containing protein